jgi:excisionase family DNA binding protein
MNSDTQVLLTREEVAERLKVHKHTIRWMERRGQIQRIRLSSRLIRYREEDVLKLLQVTPATNPA